jgi:hypothetical protein
MGGAINIVIDEVVAPVTQAITSIATCFCQTECKSKMNVYLCCKDNVTGSRGSCRSNAQTLSTNKAVDLIFKYDCYNTGWFTEGKLTTGGKKMVRAFDSDAFMNSMAAYVTTESCCKTCLCIPWCITLYKTGFMYINLEPLSEATLKVFKFTKNELPDGSHKKYINYDFAQQSTWAFAIDYNAKSINNVNNYMESEGGTGYCTGIPNKTGLQLQTLPYPYSNTVSIITTLMCWQLQQAYTSNPSVYRQRVATMTAPFLQTYFINYLHKNVDKTMVAKLGPQVWFNYYTGTGSFNVFLRLFDSMTMFIYNVVFTAANQKGVAIDDSFKSTFYRLITRTFIITLSLTTLQVNEVFNSIIPNLLSQNYDSIFKGWFNAITVSTDNGFIIASQYAPLYNDYTQLIRENYSEQVGSYVNTATVRQKLSFYRQNAINGSNNVNYQEFKALTQKKQAAILAMLASVPKFNNDSICQTIPGVCSNSNQNPLNTVPSYNPNDNPPQPIPPTSGNPTPINNKTGKKGGKKGSSCSSCVQKNKT